MIKFLLAFTTNFSKDLKQLKKEDKKLGFKLLEIIDNTVDTPFTGLGNPEPLKHQLTGK